MPTLPGWRSLQQVGGIRITQARQHRWLILAACAAFFLLGLVRLWQPPVPYFDEQVYVDAARQLFSRGVVVNREHPPLAKEMMALSIALFGDHPAAWRFPSLLAGTVALAGSSQAMRAFSRSGSATTIFTVLLATNFLLFSLARTAMLDAPMAGFSALGVMFFIQAQYWLAGTAFGLAIACKWTAIPLLGLMFLILAWKKRSYRGFAFGAIRLGVWPATVYTATFLPLFMTNTNPISTMEFVFLHKLMYAYLAGDFVNWAYEAQWGAWVLDAGPMWLVADQFGQVWRFIVLGGNPLSMLAIIPGCVAGIWSVTKRDWLVGLPTLGYLLLMLPWVLVPKPHLFYYHYLLPSTFGLAALSIQLARCWDRGIRFPAAALCLGSLALFAWFYPVLTAAPFEYRARVHLYTWMPGWEPVDIGEWRRTRFYRRSDASAQACLDRPSECS